MCRGDDQSCLFCYEIFWSHERFRLHCEEEHSFCPCHDRQFNTWHGLKEHFVQHEDHYYCQYHDEHYEHEDTFLNHCEDEHFVCRDCVKILPTHDRLKLHLQQRHNYCGPCERVFQSANNLTQHQSSRIHLPLSYMCPACSRGFVSSSALILHAESGTCGGGLTRQKVNEFTVRLDRNNVITNPSRLITGADGVQVPRETGFCATSRCWNGSAYECYLCHSTFTGLRALNVHLDSSRHREKIYRCPDAGCRQEYSALSALFQHVEFGSCGVQRFREVNDVLDSLKEGLRAIVY